MSINQLASDLSNTKLMELIKVCEIAERYDDMRIFVKQLVESKAKKGENLTANERNLMHLAYKNVISSKRASLRTMLLLFDNNTNVINKFRGNIENELEIICNEILELLIKYLYPNCLLNDDDDDNETEIFYLKLIGDYYRYLSEFRNNNNYKKLTKTYYEKAMNIAENNLNETHPLRLGLALNFSVCYFDILNQPNKAIELAKKSFDDAIDKLDNINNMNIYKDTTLIMQLLRDNLIIWTADNDQ